MNRDTLISEEEFVKLVGEGYVETKFYNGILVSSRLDGVPIRSVLSDSHPIKYHTQQNSQEG